MSRGCLTKRRAEYKLGHKVEFEEEDIALHGETYLAFVRVFWAWA
jgi:hypothetical protein